MTPRYAGDGWCLYVGDCLAVLPGLTGVDAVVTDPPYGLADKLQGGTWGKKYMGDYQDWDAQPPSPDLFGDVPSIVWGGNYIGLPPSRCWLVWFKRDAVRTMASCELAWTNLDANAKVFDWTIAATNAERNGHPTQKPVALMEWCLSFLPNAETILDPFAGSGTTGVACLRTGRRFIGIEIDEHYAQIAAKRLDRAEADVRNSLPFPEPEPRPKQAEMWEAV